MAESTKSPKSTTKKTTTKKTTSTPKKTSASKSTNGKKTSSKKETMTMSEKTTEQAKGYAAQASEVARNAADTAMSTGSYVTEEVSLVGNQLVDRVKGLIQEGNVRRITLRNADRDVIMEAPLTAGVVIGSAAVAGVLAAVGGIATALSNVHVEIHREKDKSSASKN